MGNPMENLAVHLEKDQVLCLEGDPKNDLYLIHSGKLMVCVRKGSEVIPLAYVMPGEYLGELSFFDGSGRSADIIAIERTTLIQIPSDFLRKQFPPWLVNMARYMTQRLRILDDVIRTKGIKKKNAQTISALTIQEQRYFMEKIKQFESTNS